MQDGGHQHTKADPLGLHGHRKTLLVAIFGLLFAIIAYSMIEAPDIAFEIVPNNTDLAPLYGTGERVSGTTYWANDSARNVWIFAHNPTATDITLEYYRNGTKIQDDDVHITASNNNRSKWFQIPKGTSYTINITGAHHYEWREDKILSGKNGTLSINQTVVQGGGGGVSFNGSAVDLNGSQLYNGTFDGINGTLNLKVNKSGDNMTGDLNGTTINLTSHLWIGGTPKTTKFNDISVVKVDGSSTDMGMDIAQINTTGNSRALFRISSGNNTTIDFNPNLPFTLFSDTHATPALVRSTGFNINEYRIGVSQVAHTINGWMANTHGNFTVYTVFQNATSTTTVDVATEKMRIDGKGDIYMYNITNVDPSTSANYYICMDSGTKKLFTSTALCV